MTSCARPGGLFLRWTLCLSALACLLLAGTAVRTVYPLQYRHLLLAWSDARNLDPALVAAVIRAESSFRPAAISRRGAAGLMQVMPETALWIRDQLALEDYNEDQLLDPEVNLAMGTWYLRHLLNRFGRVETALMAYNAGPSNAVRWDGDLNQAFPETQRYVLRVLRAIPAYRILLGTPGCFDSWPSLRSRH